MYTLVFSKNINLYLKDECQLTLILDHLNQSYF